MHTIMTTNNAYDMILLVNNENLVVGAWNADKKTVADFFTVKADGWNENYPEHDQIADYGIECGRDGVISDPRRAEIWNHVRECCICYRTA